MTFLFEAGQQYCTLYLRVYPLLERDLTKYLLERICFCLMIRCTEERTYKV